MDLNISYLYLQGQEPLNGTIVTFEGFTTWGSTSHTEALPTLTRVSVGGDKDTHLFSSLSED